MPDRRTHRGPHPDDARLFAEEVQPVLREALGDLCWMLSRDYPSKSSLKLVGDRYGLAARQRIALGRCACSNTEAVRRKGRQVSPSELEGRPLWIDGYNVLTSIEAALAGGVILSARDGTYRDMASMHGSYRKVEETRPALELLGETVASLGVAECRWYLDRPVSNSGRLKAIMEEVAVAGDWSWSVQLVQNPDAVLCDPAGETAEPPPEQLVVVTADSAILDRCHAWFNLARETIDRHLPASRLVKMSR